MQRSDVQHQTVAAFINTWADPMLLDAIGPTLSCYETNALVDVFAAFNHEVAAAWLLSAHAQADEPDDPHYLPDDHT